MLQLQIPGGHKWFGPDLKTLHFFRMREVVFIDYLQRERFQYLGFQARIHPASVASGNEPHFTGECKIEIQDPPPGTVTRKVIYVSFGSRFPPGVAAIEQVKFGIRRRATTSASYRPRMAAQEGAPRTCRTVW